MVNYTIMIKAKEAKEQTPEEVLGRMFECNKKTILKSSQKWTKRAKDSLIKWPEGGLKGEKEKKGEERCAQ